MERRKGRRRVIRKYNKSGGPRMRWSEELHRCFLQAVHSLGGRTKATPKRILQLMGVKGISVSHIKSHLQMYRNMCNHGIHSTGTLNEQWRHEQDPNMDPQLHLTRSIQTPSFEELLREWAAKSRDDNSKQMAVGEINCFSCELEDQIDVWGSSAERFEAKPEAKMMHYDDSTARRNQVSLELTISSPWMHK